MTEQQRHLSLASVVDQPRVDVLGERYAAAARQYVWVMTPANLAKFLSVLLEELQSTAAWHASMAEIKDTPFRPRARLRYVARCTCGRLATGYFSIVRRGKVLVRLSGDCERCWARGRVATSWLNAFHARQALVRRNLGRGELQKQLLQWVWDTEQARGNATWRVQPPDPPDPPTNGGTRRRAPLRSSAVLDLLERAA